MAGAYRKRTFCRTIICLTLALAFATTPFAYSGSTSLDRPPKLLFFDVIAIETGVYELRGRVDDEFAEGCYVRFGGALDGYYAAVYEEGHFSEVFEVGYSYGGPVSAQAIDYVDQASNVLWDEIQ